MDSTTSNRPLHSTEGAHKHREYQAAGHLNNEAVSIISIGSNKDVKYQCTHRCNPYMHPLLQKPNIALYFALFPSVVMAECVGINAQMKHKVVYNSLTNEQMPGCWPRLYSWQLLVFSDPMILSADAWKSGIRGLKSVCAASRHLEEYLTPEMLTKTGPTSG